MDDLQAHHQRRKLRALTLNAAELIRHPGATEDERQQAEWLVHQARLELMPYEHAHARISRSRAEIRVRWSQDQAA